MEAVPKKPNEELRMNSAEFDCITGQALQVKPQAAKAKPKKSAQPKTRKKVR